MKKFNSKLLLFGEYGLLYGANALAIPFPKFGGSLKFAENTRDKIVLNSKSEIQKFFSSFDVLNLNSRMNFQIDLIQWKKELQKGLYFNSDIPMQYGLGSSGALCAAIFNQYSSFQINDTDLSDNNTLQQLKHDFSLMESSFHGRSSGIDPLVSFLNQPVLFTDEMIQLPEINSQNHNFSAFLIDTKMKSSTAPLVSIFNKKMKNNEFIKRFENDFLPANNKAIQAYLAGNKPELFRQLEQISAFQSEHFSEMIPESFKEFFKNSSKNNVPTKLLGSGGGGFVLMFAENKTKIPKNIKSLKIF